jgi:hypothetical protein
MPHKRMIPQPQALEYFALQTAFERIQVGWHYSKGVDKSAQREGSNQYPFRIRIR